MDETTDRYPIGELARRTGLSARTIRYWSDSGVLPPAERSAGGYRLYRADAVGRLHLIKTLRELGLGLDSVREVLERHTTLAQAAASHVEALEAQIQILRLNRAVPRNALSRDTETEGLALTHELARFLSPRTATVHRRLRRQRLHAASTIRTRWSSPSSCERCPRNCPPIRLPLRRTPG